MSNEVGMDLIKRFCPKVFLHPYDNNHPTSVNTYLTGEYLLDQAGSVLVTDVTLNDLVAYNEATNYLRFKGDKYPTAQDDFPTGDPIVATDRKDYGACRSPVYVKSFVNEQFTDLVYAFFYAFNGFQVFRIGIGTLPTKPYNFCWARFARHEADWEHITVRLNPKNELVGAFYGQHGGSQWVEKPPLVDGTHPVVYSAWNSHASYPTSGTTELAMILGPPGLQPVGWLKAADVTTSSDVRCYQKPDPFFSHVEWTPWQNDEQIYVVDDHTDSYKWLQFLGHFGSPDLDNSHVDRPPSLPSNAQDRVFDYSKVGKFFHALPAGYLVGDGPRSPEQQQWWRHKEP